MNQHEIQKILPHRDGMLLVEAVEQDGEYACGQYLVRGDEFFLQGHFPGNPVVPGVILCEILAQSACLLLADEMTEGTLPMYTGLDRVRFKSPVRPGEIFQTRCRITKRRPPFYFAEGTGYVGDRLCLTAEFSFAIVGE